MKKVSFRRMLKQQEKEIDLMKKKFNKKKAEVFKKLIGKEAEIVIVIDPRNFHWEEIIVGKIMHVDSNFVQIQVNGKRSPKFELFDGREYHISLNDVIEIR